MDFMKILVTGGCGFIGSAFIKKALDRKNAVMNLDALTYAADPSINKIFQLEENYIFEHVDLIDRNSVKRQINDFEPDAVAHFAAESHVDNSIINASVFVKTNIEGTYNILSEALNYWEKNNRNKNFRFLHVSTDEVYGSLGEDGKFDESSPYQPNNPYSATKASSDLIVRSWNKTYNFPSIISNCCNNYGPHQNLEKLIPKIIDNGINSKAIKLYGDGSNIRDWLHVDDHVDALNILIERAPCGSKFNVGAGEEKSNIQVAKLICDSLDHKFPDKAPHYNLIEFVPDRLGHDYRYAVNGAAMIESFNWKPKIRFRDGLRHTIEWYIKHLTQGY